MSTLTEVSAIEPAGARESRRLRVLHVIITLGQTNSQYNEHCLPLVGSRDLSICTYFKPELEPCAEIDVYPGDGTLPGFFRALGTALTRNEYDIIHAHAPTTGALVMTALARWNRRALWRKLVYTAHGSFYDYKLRNKLFMIAVFGSFRRVVFCGRAAQASYPALWRWLTGNRSRVVPNGADLDRVERAIAGTTRRRADASFRILFVGRLEKVKDPWTLISAFRQIADDRTHLSLVGPGSLRDALATVIREDGLSNRVELTGLLPRDDVFIRCTNSDVFVSSSVGEGLPVGVIEAMAAGCPVVLSDIPPHRELTEGVDFVPLVTPGDSNGFAQEILRLRDMEADERATVGRKCRELVRSRFDLPRMHVLYEETYREIL